MKNNIYIKFNDIESEYINDTLMNFEYSKAKKYLEYYKQDNNKYTKLFNYIPFIDFVEDTKDDFYKVDISAIWYSQSEWQDWELFFNTDILKDPEAMDELKYFKKDMKYYFTSQAVLINWYIEDIKIIDWKEYKYKQNLESLFCELLDESIKDEYVKDFVNENWFDPKDYILEYDTEDITY